ncbi:hypothetical protein HY025_05935 [Candidatus Daviesbacteria bacterium]|nr:hypothetical protein [Candidatus Daviesbacteria bacterium]
MKLRLFLLLLILIILPFISLGFSGKVISATTSCSISGQAKIDGLVSTPNLTNDISTTTGACVVNDQAAGVQLDQAKIIQADTYDDLKSIFYTKSKYPNKFLGALPGSFTTDGLYSIGSLTVSTSNYPFTGYGTEVIFIDNNLTIDKNIVYPTTSGKTGGLVFVVKGNVSINDASVTEIDAVLIAQGVDPANNPTPSVNPYSICSSYELDAFGAISCPPYPAFPILPTQALKINGSLISLGSQNPSPIRLRRTLTDNSTAAEQITAQPKYLSLLAVTVLGNTTGLMSESLLIPVQNK